MPLTITLDSDLKDLVKVAALRLHQARVTSPSTGQQLAMATLDAELATEHRGRTPAEIAGLQAARRLYRAAGVDPTRTRPSSEALLRRVLKGQGLPTVNSAVDACNELSLRLLLPLGLYDASRIQGPVTLRKGREGEGYPGIRKEDVHLTGRLALFDERGPFGSPTSDSPRTCVTEVSTELLLVVFAPGDIPSAGLEEALALGADIFAHWCGSRAGDAILLG